MAMANLEQTLQNIHITEVDVTLPFDVVRLILQELYNIYYKLRKDLETEHSYLLSSRNWYMFCTIRKMNMNNEHMLDQQILNHYLDISINELHELKKEIIPRFKQIVAMEFEVIHISKSIVMITNLINDHQYGDISSVISFQQHLMR